MDYDMAQWHVLRIQMAQDRVQWRILKIKKLKYRPVQKTGNKVLLRSSTGTLQTKALFCVTRSYFQVVSGNEIEDVKITTCVSRLLVSSGDRDLHFREHLSTES